MHTKHARHLRAAARSLNRFAALAILTLTILTVAAPAFAGVASTSAESDLAPFACGLIGLGIVATAGKSIKELREMRGELIPKIEELRTKNDDEKREWSAEDQSTWDDVFGDFRKVERSIDAAQASERGRNPDNDDFEERDDDKPRRGSGDERRKPITDETRAQALAAFCRGANGINVPDEEREAAVRLGVNPYGGTMDIRLAPKACLRGHERRQMWTTGGGYLHEQRHRDVEERDMSVGTNADGGYTVPTGFVNEFERTLLAFGGARQVARILRTNSGNPLELPTVNDTGNTGERLSEAASIGSSVDPVFGQKSLTAYKYSSKAILVSHELLQDSAFDLAMEIAMLLGERIGRIQNNEFTLADGSSKPQGLVPASTLGKTAVSATALDPDELRDLMHSVDPAYRNASTCGWMFNDTTLNAIAQLKQDSKYVWQPGLTTDVPNTIWNKPYTINQDMASAATTTIPVVFGDFRRFIIRDAGAMRLRRLDERYADTDQVGFIAFLRSDSELMNTAAVKHMQMA